MVPGSCTYPGYLSILGRGARPLTCHSEGAGRPKNLPVLSQDEILRSPQDDKIASPGGFSFRPAASLARIDKRLGRLESAVAVP
jgi:hypothetical protein